VLHEGTHAFMDLVLGELGPAWYAEGTAELMGTHCWQDGRLTLRYMPPDKTATPGWGRIKIVKDEVAAGRGMMPTNILQYGPQAHLRNEPYGWCWAFAAFLDAHPKYQQAFRTLRAQLGRGNLTQTLEQALSRDWGELSEEWQLFVMNLEYGYDVARAAIVRKPAQVIRPSGSTAVIQADRGWQSSGLRLDAGVAYQITATGRYQIGETTGIWWCEPGGVTIRYYQGLPIGTLQGAVRDDQQPLRGLTPLAKPQTIGLAHTLTPQKSGTLYLKINESAADLGDNQGQITVHVR
jgi:hypothetical protein